MTNKLIFIVQFVLIGMVHGYSYSYSMVWLLLTIKMLSLLKTLKPCRTTILLQRSNFEKTFIPRFRKSSELQSLLQ